MFAGRGFSSWLVNLASRVTGILPVANGGTSKALTPVVGGVVYTDADSMEILAANTTTTKKFLVTTGTGSAGQTPAWDTIISGDITTALTTPPPIGADTPSTAAFTTLTANTGRIVAQDGLSESTETAVVVGDYGRFRYFSHGTNNAAYTLPVPALGSEIRFIKNGTGSITLTAAATTYIEDSSAAGTIYCSGTGIATITLQGISTTRWVIVSATGTWTTT